MTQVTQDDQKWCYETGYISLPITDLKQQWLILHCFWDITVLHIGTVIGRWTCDWQVAGSCWFRFHVT